ncbi:MAG: hypothetical protein WBB82_02145 [Limnothrix sp.]
MAAVFSLGIELIADLGRYQWIAGLGSGLVLSFVQAIALKSTFLKLEYWQWLVANMLAAYLGIGLNVWLETQIADFDNPLLILMRYGAVMGSCLGTAQLITLKIWVTTKAFLLWLANVCGWAIALPLAALSAFLLILKPFADPTHEPSIGVVLLAAAVTGLILGTIYGTITGWILATIIPATPRRIKKRKRSP